MDNLNNRLITKNDVENILNYFENIGNNGERLSINNLEHYQSAFVHESYYQSIQYNINTNINNTNDNIFFYIPKESSERLEYLGDHILKAIMGRYLFERFGNEREGFLTKLKIKIEKCSMLHKIGMALGFKKFLLLSLQVENQTILDLDRGRNTPSYYEDAFEAFIGSILVDFGELGYLYADRFVRSIIENIIDFAELISKNDNFKDSLQRYFQSLKWQTPVYSSLNEEGPLYRKVFTRMLTITNSQFMELNQDIQRILTRYTLCILEEYKVKNQNVYLKLIDYHHKGLYFLGIGFGRKVTNAEQECAKQCLINLNLDLNF
jgi:dsRNA-specific ribonuclease